jgi:integrase
LLESAAQLLRPSPLRWLFEGTKDSRCRRPPPKVFTTAAGKPASRRCLVPRHDRLIPPARGGTNILVIQALLGHRSLETTQIYTHVARTYVNSTASPLDRLKQKREEEPAKE